MKFFHVYNEECFKGLEKNGLINKDTGFKIQHCFAVPYEKKFNEFAAKGGKLHSMIKKDNIPFYVDRIAGGITYHKYDFDKELIKEYIDLLGEWFLGFQLHESGSNRRRNDWQRILRLNDGSHGPYDAKKLRELTIRDYAQLPDGTPLSAFSQDTPEFYANIRYAETPEEFFEEMRDLFKRRMSEVEGRILPCDSGYLATKIQDEVGMNTFMPEVGCQIVLMRLAVSVARGMAKASKKMWGTYYECWRNTVEEDGNVVYTMPCFNLDPTNEWYLTQQMHPDDFTSYGENGGSSRLLQNRIYYYSLMAGADYMGEEWGLNCSYTDMQDFTLSEYGIVKKNFINKALTLRNVKAKIPFAVVLPKDYSCVEIYDYKRDDVGEYLLCKLAGVQKERFGHINDIIKLLFERTSEIGNEGHVITNSRFPDVFDIIYEDASDEAFRQYDYLIDATKTGDFLAANKNKGYKILESRDLNKLEKELQALIPEVMPCYADDLCYLVSEDENGSKYFSIFNNEGNERCLRRGNIIHREADKTVKVTFKEAANISVIAEGADPVKIERIDDFNYNITVPAASFAVIRF
ncbi:MAG: hypothetical protein IJN99_00655 [Clostridia bacterium]|nr:hypothetical protein [Clostridia bacterium]